MRVLVQCGCWFILTSFNSTKTAQWKLSRFESWLADSAISPINKRKKVEACNEHETVSAHVQPKRQLQCDDQHNWTSNAQNKPQHVPWQSCELLPPSTLSLSISVRQEAYNTEFFFKEGWRDLLVHIVVSSHHGLLPKEMLLKIYKQHSHPCHPTMQEFWKAKQELSFFSCSLFFSKNKKILWQGYCV
jgi:hypothetical protein